MTRSNILIAVAEAEDAAAFVQLRGLTRENAVSQARLESLGITAVSWAQEIRSGELTGFVAKQGAAMVGYCFGNTGTGEIVVLALLPDAEGQGFGRALLTQTIEALRRVGHRRLFLGCSADPEVRSHGFYRHLGWRPTGAFDDLGDEVLELDLEPRSPRSPPLPP